MRRPWSSSLSWTTLYGYLDADRYPLYVGITFNGPRRRVDHLGRDFASAQYVSTDVATRAEAARREFLLIERFRPTYNVNLLPDWNNGGTDVLCDRRGQEHASPWARHLEVVTSPSYRSEDFLSSLHAPATKCWTCATPKLLQRALERDVKNFDPTLPNYLCPKFVDQTAETPHYEDDIDDFEKLFHGRQDCSR